MSVTAQTATSGDLHLHQTTQERRIVKNVDAVYVQDIRYDPQNVTQTKITKIYMIYILYFQTTYML